MLAPMSGTFLGFVSFGLVLGAGIVWMRRMQAVRIPRNRGAFVVAMAAGALLGVAALARGVGWIGGVPAGFAAFTGSFFLVLFAISRQKGGSGRFQPGAPLPEFSAPDDRGETFAVSSDSGRPLLLKFFRGHW
jgi:hypothetical protein